MWRIENNKVLIKYVHFSLENHHNSISRIKWAFLHFSAELSFFKVGSHSKDSCIRPSSSIWHPLWRRNGKKISISWWEMEHIRRGKKFDDKSKRQICASHKLYCLFYIIAFASIEHTTRYTQHYRVLFLCSSLWIIIPFSLFHGRLKYIRKMIDLANLQFFNFLPTPKKRDVCPQKCLFLVAFNAKDNRHPFFYKNNFFSYYFVYHSGRVNLQQFTEFHQLSMCPESENTSNIALPWALDVG